MKFPPGYDFGTVYTALARRYTALARGVTGAPQLKRFAFGGRRSAAPVQLPRPRTPEEMKRDARQQQNARLSKLFQLAMTRDGGVDLAVKLLTEGLKTREIEVVLRTLPQASQRRGGLAARIAARDALAAVPASHPTRSAQVTALIGAYNKALGIQS